MRFSNVDEGGGGGGEVEGLSSSKRSISLFRSLSDDEVGGSGEESEIEIRKKKIFHRRSSYRIVVHRINWLMVVAVEAEVVVE